MSDIKEKAKRLHILDDVIVEADLSGMCWGSRYRESEEEWAKQLERAAKEFHDFLRDHRSQDMVVLDVVRKYKDVCSVCKDTWELDKDDNDVLICAACGAEIEEEKP